MASAQSIGAIVRTTAKYRHFKISNEQVADMIAQATHLEGARLVVYLSNTLEAIEKRQRGFVDGDGI